VSYPDPLVVRAAVEAELARGDAAAAFELLHPVAFSVAAEEGGAFRELVDRLPVEIWHRSPMIAAALGQSYRAPDAPRGAPGLTYFAAAEDALAAHPDAPVHCLAAVLAGYAGALRSSGRLREARAKLEAAEAMIEVGLGAPLPAFMEVQARVALERGILDLHAGRHREVREHLLLAHALAGAHLGRAEQTECAGALAIMAFAFGDLAAAERWSREGRDLAIGTPIERSGFSAPALIAQLMAELDRDRVTAAADLEPVILAAAANTEWEPYAALAVASVRAVQGRPAEAIDRLIEARRRFETWDVHGFARDYTELVRASQLRARGRGDEAWSILAGIEADELHVLCPGRYRAAQLLAGGDLHGADEALRPCEELGHRHAERGMQEVRLLRGAIAAELGDMSTSDLNVDLAFIGMARTGSRVPLRWVPPALLAGLVASALQRSPSPEVRELLERTQRATDGAERTVEPLSRRERLVLAQAERGATVASIAAAMYISPNTVKTHLRRVYRKLGVTTRDEAIRRARTLGLHEITRDSPVPRSPEPRGTHG
jgi:LuxR family transcriptional regulator, maltose regulon positive regulatory protein